MNTRLLALFFLVFLVSCKPGPEKQILSQEVIISQPEDKRILEEIFELCSDDEDVPISALMVKVGSFFLETPYVAHTLETEEEHLLINLREFDCTTFAENCLAISRCIKSGKHTFAQFASELMNIRYRDGKLDGYPSRLHYFCDWIYNNQEKSLIRDMSEDIAKTPLRKEINFMSTHPDSYRQLKEQATLVGLMAEQEKRISAREMHYIPVNLIGEVEDKLKDGDIAGICTDIEGIAIMHVVILIRQEGRIHMMHASSKAEKVVISENTLEDYLLNRKSASGIMVARPL
jgi:hypothetical protein